MFPENFEATVTHLVSLCALARLATITPGQATGLFAFRKLGTLPTRQCAATAVPLPSPPFLP